MLETPLRGEDVHTFLTFILNMSFNMMDLLSFRTNHRNRNHSGWTGCLWIVCFLQVSSPLLASLLEGLRTPARDSLSPASPLGRNNQPQRVFSTHSPRVKAPGREGLLEAGRASEAETQGSEAPLPSSLTLSGGGGLSMTMTAPTAATSEAQTPGGMSGDDVGQQAEAEGGDRQGGSAALGGNVSVPASQAASFPPPGGSSQDISCTDLQGEVHDVASSRYAAHSAVSGGGAALASSGGGRPAPISESAAATISPPIPFQPPTLSSETEPPMGCRVRTPHSVTTEADSLDTYSRIVTFNASVLHLVLAAGSGPLDPDSVFDLVTAEQPAGPLFRGPADLPGAIDPKLSSSAAMLVQYRDAAMAALQDVLQRRQQAIPLGAPPASVGPAALSALRLWGCASLRLIEGTLRRAGRDGNSGGESNLFMGDLNEQREEEAGQQLEELAEMLEILVFDCGLNPAGGRDGAHSGILQEVPVIFQEALMLFAAPFSCLRVPSAEGRQRYLSLTTPPGGTSVTDVADDAIGPYRVPSAASSTALRVLLALMSHGRPEVRVAGATASCVLSRCSIVDRGKRTRAGRGANTCLSAPTEEEYGLSLRARLLTAAVGGLSDEDPQAAAAAAALLASLSGTLLALSSRGGGIGPAGLESAAPAWQAVIALKPQGLDFRPEQLQQLFELLVPDAAADAAPGGGGLLLRRKAEDDHTSAVGGVSPGGIPRPSAANASSGTGDATEGTAVTALGGMDPAAVARLVSSLSDRLDGCDSFDATSLPWLLIQEGARACVSSKVSLNRSAFIRIMHPLLTAFIIIMSMWYTSTLDPVTPLHPSR